MRNSNLLPTSQVYEFGVFRLDAGADELFVNAETVKLAPKVLQCLILLVENRGKTITKDEFFEKVWTAAFVEDNALSYTISQLRKTLAEFDKETKYIETVSRRGFRFAANVKQISPALPAANREFTLERRKIEEVWIEETEDVQARDSRPLLLPAKTAFGKLWLTGVAVLIVFFAGGGFLLWKNQGKETVKTLAVLPLKQFGNTVGDESMSLRIADSLITTIGNLKQISVRPTTSIIKFTNDQTSALEIGKMLEVDAVLDGSIQQEGENLRINLQMISVSSGEQIWAEQFDGKTSGLLNLQDAVSAKLINQLDLRLSDEQETAFKKQPTSNPEAFEEYLMGRYFWNKRTPESLKSAISSYQNSIRLDPDFAEAYVGLADSYYLLFDYSYDTSPVNVVLANENLAKAIELDPNLAEAYVTRGLIQTTHEWKWQDAEQSFFKAVELAPNSPNAHHRYAMLLLKLRRFNEAETQMLRARQLDPTSPSINMNLGVIYYFSKRYEDAVTQLKKTIALDTAFASPRWYLARCYWMQGNAAESFAEYVRAMTAVGDDETAELIERRSAAGEPDAILKDWIEKWAGQISPTGISAHDLAILTAHRQNREETLKWLERSVAVRHPWTTWIDAEPEFDFVRDDPRFQEILRKMNLEH